MLNKVDQEYFRLLAKILNSNNFKKNRTGIDTLSIFGEQARFNVSLDEFPILTTKKVYFRAIVHELLWFLSGNTNIKYLVDNDVHIWDEWAYKNYNDYYTNLGYPKQVGDDYDRIHSRELECDADALFAQYSQERFIYRIKNDAEFAEKWGELGEGTYGGMWRKFPYYEKEPWQTGFGEGEYIHEKSVDQLQKVIDKLKTNPDDRRMIVSAWHPHWSEKCILAPCHCLFHFNTEEFTFEDRWSYAIKIGKHSGVTWEGEKYVSEHLDEMNIPKRKLNLLLYQRSCDFPLGVPFNITSYSLLLAMIAHCVNMVPGEFIHTYGDAHIYKNQIKGVIEQLSRDSYPLPKLWLNPNNKDIFSFRFDDIKLIDYQSHPTIKFPIAV